MGVSVVMDLDYTLRAPVSKFSFPLQWVYLGTVLPDTVVPRITGD